MKNTISTISQLFYKKPYLFKPKQTSMMRIFSACKTLILLMFFAIPTQVLKAQCTVGAASSVPIVCPNTAITNITHSTTGATGNGTPTGLPTGVTAAWASNKITISGAPSVAGIYNYSIPLTGGCGSEKATGKIMVKSSPTTTIIGNNTICNPTLNANATSGGGSVGSVITAIAGGGSHSLFLKNDGTVWATGCN